LTYVELAVSAPSEDEETVAAALAACGTLGMWRDEGLTRAYFPSNGADLDRAFERAWEELTGQANPPPRTVRVIPSEDWLLRWKSTARPIAATPSLWVSPPDADPPAEGYPPGANVIIIQPGEGFGTGSHATTRSLLRWLETETGFDTVLDVGTGSGILAITAVRLGARRVVGLDIDESALQNAAENRVRNDCGGRLHLVRGSVNAVGPDTRFDRVVANLDREALGRLMVELTDLCEDDGRLGIAGLLSSERDEALRPAILKGWELVDEVFEADSSTGDEWWSGWLGRSR
jgi:ribosomal protein L11 methyltransferase